MNEEEVKVLVKELHRLGGPEDGCEDEDVHALWAVVQKYAFGSCDELALGLHELSGLPLGLAEMRLHDSSYFSFRHAFVVVDGSASSPWNWRVADISGVKTVTDMMEPYMYPETEDDHVRFITMDNPQEFAKRFELTTEQSPNYPTAKSVALACFYLNEITGGQATLQNLLHCAREIQAAKVAVRSTIPRLASM